MRFWMSFNFEKCNVVYRSEAEGKRQLRIGYRKSYSLSADFSFLVTVNEASNLIGVNFPTSISFIPFRVTASDRNYRRIIKST